MKKNYSLFAKLSVAAVAVLGGVFAWATEPTPNQHEGEQQIWIRAKEINVGDEFTFVAEKKDGDKVTTYYLLNSGDVAYVEGTIVAVTEAFTVIDGYKEGTYAFQGKGDGVLTEDLAVEQQTLVAENSWSLNGSQVLNASNTPRYVYFNEDAKKFMTTTDAKDVNYLVKTWVKKPVFGEDKLKEDVFVGSETQSVEVTASTSQNKGTVEYRISTRSDNSTWTSGEWTSPGEASATINMNVLAGTKFNDLYVKVEIRTKCAEGATVPTEAETKVKHIIILNDAKLTPVAETIADDGTYKVKVETSCGATMRWHIQATPNGRTNVSSEWADVPQDGMIDLVAAWLKLYGANTTNVNGGNVKLYVESKKSGHKDDSIIETHLYYTLKPNGTNVFGDLKADPNAESVLEVGQVVKLSHDVISGWTLASGIGKAKITEIDGKKLETPVNVTLTWNTDHYEFTVPAAVKDPNASEGSKATVGFVIATEAGTFTATKGTSAVNKYNSPKGEIRYGGTYETATWTINPYKQTLDADKSPLTVDFEINPKNGWNSNEDVKFLDAGLVKVTDSQNNTVGKGATVVKKVGEKNVFTVTFDQSVIDKYFSDKMTGDYMVAFETGALYTKVGENWQKNKSNITGYINFRETALLSAPKLVTETVCTDCDDTFDFTITAKGKKSNNDLTSNLSLVEGAHVIIYNDDATYKAEVKASSETGKFTVTIPDAVKVDGTYTVEIPNTIFLVNGDTKAYYQQSAEDNKKECTLYVWDHVTFKAVPTAYKSGDTKLKFTITGTPKENNWHNGGLGKHNLIKDPETYAMYLPVKVDGVDKKANVVEYKFTSIDFEIDMDDVLNAESYTITIPEGHISGNLDKNTELETTCKFYVNYYIQNKVYEIDTDETSVTYRVYGKQANGKDVPAGKIEYVGETEKPAVDGSASFNDGLGENYPQIQVLNDGTDEFGAYTEFIAKWKNQLAANNYQINFPVGTLQVEGSNANESKLFVNFRVMNAIKIGVPEEIYVLEGTKEVPVTITGWDKVDEVEADASVNFLKDKKVKFAGVEYDAAKKITTADALEIGDYELEIPAGTVKADFTEQKTALKTTVHVIGVQIVLKDKTINELYAEEEELKTVEMPLVVMTKGANDAEYVVNKAYKVIGNSNPYAAFATGEKGKVVAKTKFIDEIETETTPEYKAADAPCTNISFDNPTATITVTCDPALTNAKNEQSIVSLDKKQFNVAPATKDDPKIYGMTENDYYINGNIYVTRDFTFDDQYKKVSTTAKEVAEIIPEGDEKADDIDVTYRRSFSGTKIQGVAMPIKTPVKDMVAAGIKVYRIDFFHNSGDILELTELTEGYMQANMPYIIQPDEKGDKVVKFNTTVAKPDRDYVICSTTMTIYYFEGRTEPMAYKEGYYTLTGGKIQKWSGTQVQWRWVMFVKGQNPDYVRVAIDGVIQESDNETAISEVSAEDLLDGEIYNMAGQKQSHLQKGINIINGVKVLVK